MRPASLIPFSRFTFLMKKLFIILATVVSTSGALLSCKDSSKDPMPDVEYAPVIFPKFTDGFATYDLDSLKISEPYSKGHVVPVIEFTFDPGDQRDVKLQAVEVYKTFRRTNAGAVENSPRVLVGSYSSFPATVRITSDEAIKDLKRIINGTPTQLTKNQIVPRGSQAPDAFVFTFEYILQDGRRIVLTPTNTQGIATGAQINAPFAAVAQIVRKTP
jgi:hypothetical protein